MEIVRELDIIGSQNVSSAASQLANQLATIYTLYLKPFDDLYVLSYMQEVEHRKKQADLIECHIQAGDRSRREE